ncbi:hypothetical protein JG688_00015147 [Phytophthora aleatoria]|uniref:Uncharacterized protein n=1 Tax=Phytophthora aleatoria TaxID=2496075 RepID=A0A8J5ITW6_9STRA|nr:hypothetical protein JG688_00015147 [Phytophthora aleatoria]
MQEQVDKMLRFIGRATSKTMKGQGRKEMFPDVSAIVTFMKDKRRDEVFVETSLYTQHHGVHELGWVTNGIADKRGGLLALPRMCERLANR